MISRHALTALARTEQLGKGAFASVEKQLHKGKAVAVKTPNPALDLEELQEVFRSEVAALTQLTHANILKLIGVVEPDSKSTMPKLVLEFFDGAILTEIERVRRCTYEEKLGVLLQVRLRLRQQSDASLQIARVMEFIHRAGYVHRDLSHHNMLVDSNLKVKLAMRAVPTAMIPWCARLRSLLRKPRKSASAIPARSMSSRLAFSCSFCSTSPASRNGIS